MQNLHFILFQIFIGLCNLTAQEIDHYVFFNRDRADIHLEFFTKNDALAGAQIKYTWRQLEPEKDRYDFSMIQEDLAFLQSIGKRLFIQIQDVSFDTTIINVPDYLLQDNLYHGGIALQYLFRNDADEIERPDGWVTRRWDDEVAKRFHALLTALGKALDGQIEGINLPETAVGFGTTGKYHPPGFSYETYRDAILVNMKAAKRAFPQSVVIQYANFMPGEWLPWNDKSYLHDLYRYAVKAGIGMGGPDIKIFKKAQMNHSYKFMQQYAGQLTSGVAVQYGNYEEINPKTGKRVTVPEIYAFGKEQLKLKYIFWSRQEPYFTEGVLRFLKGLK